MVVEDEKAKRERRQPDADMPKLNQAKNNAPLFLRSRSENWITG